MKLRTILTITLVLVFAAGGLFAQDTESKTKVGLMMFANWSQNLTDEGDANLSDGDKKNTFGFERAWVIVSHKFDSVWSMKFIGAFEDKDAGDDIVATKQKYSAYLFLANIQAKKAIGPAIVTFQMGLIDPPLIIWSEKLSDQRWVHVNTITASSAYLASAGYIGFTEVCGQGAKLQFNIMKMVEIVGTITNGEGRMNVNEAANESTIVPTDNTANSAHGKAYAGRVTFTPIPTLYLSGYYRRNETSVNGADWNRGYYGGGVNYRDNKLLNIGLHIVKPFVTEDGDTPENADGDEIDLTIVDAHLGIYLDTIIGMPVFIMAKHGWGEDEATDDTKITFTGIGVGYKFIKGVRAILWYEQTDSELADTLDAANPSKKIAIKIEAKF